MKFTVQRDRWCRGGNGGRSQLLNEQGNMCCLGFLSKACGLKDEDILRIHHPMWLMHELGMQKYPREMSGLICGGWSNSKVCHELMEVNDAIGVSGGVREKALTELFAQIGIEVSFV